MDKANILKASNPFISSTVPTVPPSVMGDHGGQAIYPLLKMKSQDV